MWNRNVETFLGCDKEFDDKVAALEDSYKQKKEKIVYNHISYI